MIVMRHAGLGLLGNDNAADFDADNLQVVEAAKRLKRRCKLAAPDQAVDVNRHIESLMAEWQIEVKCCQVVKRKLVYQVSDRDNGRDRLLYNHDDKIRGLWPTLQSLRNVENTALLKVL